MSEQYVRLELPGGYIRVVKWATYQNLCTSLDAMRQVLEKAEHVPEPNGELQAILKGGPLWKKVLLTSGR